MPTLRDLIPNMAQLQNYILYGPQREQAWNEGWYGQTPMTIPWGEGQNAVYQPAPPMPDWFTGNMAYIGGNPAEQSSWQTIPIGDIADRSVGRENPWYTKVFTTVVPAGIAAIAAAMGGYALAPALFGAEGAGGAGVGMTSLGGTSDALGSMLVGGTEGAGLGTAGAAGATGTGTWAGLGSAYPEMVGAGLEGASGAAGATGTGMTALGGTSDALGSMLSGSGGGLGSLNAVNLASSALSAGASIYSAINQSNAVKDATNAATKSAQDALRVQETQAEITRQALQQAAQQGIITIDEANRAAQAALAGGYDAARKEIGPKFDQAISLFAPYQAAGSQALTGYMGLLKDASSIAQNAGYQFEQDQIRKTVENLASRLTGGGPSGDIVNMATQLGRNLASTELDKYLNRYTPIIGLGETSNLNVATLLQNEGNILGSLDVNQGTNEANRLIQQAVSKANLGMQAAGGQASFTANTLPSMSNTIQNLGTLQASGITNQANINSNMISNLSNIFSSASQNYLLNDILQNPQKYPGLFGGGSTSTYSGSSTGGTGSVNLGNLAAALNQGGGLNMGLLTYSKT